MSATFSAEVRGEKQRSLEVQLSIPEEEEYDIIIREGVPLKMAEKVNWQVTATTIRCDFVSDFAVLMVHGDGTAKCAYVNRWSARKEGKKRLKNCKGRERPENCHLVSEFRERAFSM